MTAPTPKGESDEKPETDLAATVTPKPGDTVRIRFDYVGEVDEGGDVRVPWLMKPNLGVFVPVTRPDNLPDHWTVEIVTPPLDEPTTLGTVVVTAGGNKAVCLGGGLWQIIGGVGRSRWDDLTQPVRLATEEELG